MQPTLTPDQKTAPPDRLTTSFNRSQKLTAARMKNIRYADDMKAFLRETVIDDSTITGYLNKFNDSLCACSTHSLYRKLNGSRYVSFIGAKSCNHRLCNVCNMLRAKKLRRKFFNFFQSTEKNVKVKESQFSFFPNLDNDEKQVSVLPSGKVKRYAFVTGSDLLQNTDFMHLTLTVPHAAGIWNGLEYYAKQLIERFHTLRKCAWWNDLVFGGEYSVETTQKAGQLHIHIHALLMVKQVQGSRNLLYKNILLKWNELTTDPAQPVAIFTPERLNGLRAALRFLKPKTYYLELPDKNIFSENNLPDDEDPFFEKNLRPVLDKLDPRGSTLVGLKSLYHEITPTQYAIYKRGTFTDNGKYYKYCTMSTNGKPPTINQVKSLLRGVLECLKYHFEPCSIEDTTGHVDGFLLTQLLPNIYRQRLYGKFGGLYGLSQLNVMEEPLNETDIIEEAQETALEAFDPQTGAPIERNEYSYIIADARHVSYDANGRHYYLDPDKIRFEIPPESSPTMISAVKAFAMYAVEHITEDKRERHLIQSFEKFV